MRTLLSITALSLFLLCGAAEARDVTEGVDTEQGTSPEPAQHEAVPANPSGGGGGSVGGNMGNGITPQTCTDSCNRAYETCMDQQSAVSGNGDTLRYSNNFADKLIGTSSDCSDHLRTCLNECGG